MSWFVKLDLVNGGQIYVRPDMVKAVYPTKHGATNVVIDGHDFEVVGSPVDILRAVEFDVHCVCEGE